MRNARRAAFLGAWLFSVTTLFAVPPAEELIQEVHLFGPAPRMVVEATMEIAESGTTQERDLEAWFEREARAFSLFVQVVRPPFLRNMKFLLLRNSGREESWMRTSRGVRRLGSSSGEERVFGSHFSARDFSRISPEETRIAYVEEPDGSEAVIDVKEKSGTGRRRFRVDLESRLITGIEFYGADGLIEKEYRLLDADRIDGVAIPRRGRMTEGDGGGSTTITLTEVEFPSSIPRRYFSRGNL